MLQINDTQVITKILHVKLKTLHLGFIHVGHMCE